jgi:hypothetical protein
MYGGLRVISIVVLIVLGVGVAALGFCANREDLAQIGGPRSEG